MLKKIAANIGLVLTTLVLVSVFYSGTLLVYLGLWYHNKTYIYLSLLGWLMSRVVVWSLRESNRYKNLMSKSWTKKGSK